MYNFTIMAALGMKNKDQEALMMLIKESAAADGGFQAGDFFPSVEILSVINGQKYKLDKIHRELDRIFEVIIYEHKVRREAIKTSESEGDEDLVDVLLRVQENTSNIIAVLDCVVGLKIASICNIPFINLAMSCSIWTLQPLQRTVSVDNAIHD
ncbi:hypothetical protein Vadar_003761 [Vaccinium darrowii]|uniref:Uncharacterized protein n=1 Tax=Vaccinium darrowii TaxID=229202 RepID=A0ACB7XN25_9ERIC|nr:hypothetical protein Vadar_003761 [Vaccinium darrowii]